MWGFLTQLGVCIVLIGFFVVSCQNVVHIVRGAAKFVLRRLHTELDRELGEGGVDDDEETLTTKVVRRRVIVKVKARGVVFILTRLQVMIDRNCIHPF